jgi:hypothetical protein
MIVWLVATGMIACPRDCHGHGILSSHWPLQSSTHADSEHTGTCGRMVAGIQILVMWTSNTETNTPIRSLFPQWGILLKFIFVAPFLGLKKRIKRATVNRDVDSHSSARGQFSIHLNRSRPIKKRTPKCHGDAPANPVLAIQMCSHQPEDAEQRANGTLIFIFACFPDPWCTKPWNRTGNVQKVLLRTIVDLGL